MSIGELKPSMTIAYNANIYTILNCEHAKLGRGPAFCRVKLKNIMNAQILDCTLRDSDNIQPILVEKRKLQYLYTSGTHYHFLDFETYEDLILDESRIKDKICWLKDNLELVGFFYENKLIELEVPLSLELKIVETDPGFRGNTVKAGTKSAKLETGLIINVPLFLNTEDTVKVDTQTKNYLGRK